MKRTRPNGSASIFSHRGRAYFYLYFNTRIFLNPGVLHWLSVSVQASYLKQKVVVIQGCLSFIRPYCVYESDVLLGALNP